MDNQPSQSFERELSPDEERNALLNFMGSAYGEIKKIDSNIISQSSTLKATTSEQVKKQIEQVYNKPQIEQPQVYTKPEVQQPQVQAQQPVALVNTVPLDDNQLSFNFDVNEKEELFNLIEKILTRLDRLHRKVDELTLVHSDFIQTYQQAQEIVAKKKSTNKKRVGAKKEI